MDEPARHRPAGLEGRTRIGERPRPAMRRRGLVLACLLLASLAAGAAACGGSTVKPTPTSTRASATATAGLRLSDPTTADAVYSGLVGAGLAIVGTNAEAGTDPVKRINATIGSQPLVIIGYSSDAARQRLDRVTDGAVPGKGQPPYTFAALNVVLELGPSTPGVAPLPPDPSLVATARDLANALRPLLGPLIERSASRVSPTPLPTPSPVMSPSPTPKASPTR